MLYWIFNIPYHPAWVFVSILAAFFATFFAIRAGLNRLPKDQGRAYAVNGELSKGKPRGAGLLFTLCTVAVFLVFVPFELEYVLYYGVVLLSMLAGYFDDRSKRSWGELKKGLIDAAICLIAALTYVVFNPNPSVSLFGMRLALSPWVFVPVAAFLLWICINFTNCTDGVDGLLGTVSSVTLGTFALIFLLLGTELDLIQMNVVFIASLLAYLVYNASPSRILMGDAGSRAIGVFIGIMSLKTGNLLFCIPAAFVILLDGGIGLFKLLFIRITKKKNFLKSIRTPLHDHARYKFGWSDTQVGYRFAIIQLLVSLLCVAAMLLQR